MNVKDEYIISAVIALTAIGLFIFTYITYSNTPGMLLFRTMIAPIIIDYIKDIILPAVVVLLIMLIILLYYKGRR